MRLCAVIPAYNEATRIAGVIRSVKQFVPDILVVIDGSTDETERIARAEGVHVFVHAENCGAGAATMTGIEAARRLGFDTVVTLDADGQHAASDIPRLLEALKTGNADLVIANRFGRKNAIPMIRRIANGIGNFVTFAVTGVFLPDTQCGFKVFGPKALSELDLKMSGFEFCTEIIREAARKKWKIVSIPSKVVYSEYTLAKGQSFSSGLQTACKILLRTFLR